MSLALIDKGIPLPRARGPGRKPKYPWKKMEVGDSFLAVDISHQAMAAAARMTWHRTGKKFATRMVDGGVRVWRVL